MENEINKIKEKFLTAVKNIKNSNTIKDIKAEFLGKKSQLNDALKTLSSLAEDKKREFGTKINSLRLFITKNIETLEKNFEEQKIKQQLEKKYIDVTLPIREKTIGSIHPLSYVIQELREIMSSMGFMEAIGTEIETDWFNFEGLNTPPHHPARQMQDTFYLTNNSRNEKVVLRTQTTAVELREMSAKNKKPPFKFFVADRTFRREIDATHCPMFHQLEGVYVNKGITMQDLKDCLTTIIKKFFNLKQVPLRFRPSYFPFTSPSVEIDIRCKKTENKIILGDGDDWIEILGAGMLHPTVLKNADIDIDIYTGFAFGAGIERFSMLKYGIRDMRNLYDGDIRFLKHYSFSSI